MDTGTRLGPEMSSLLAEDLVREAGSALIEEVKCRERGSSKITKIAYAGSIWRIARFLHWVGFRLSDLRGIGKPYRLSLSDGFSPSRNRKFDLLVTTLEVDEFEPARCSSAGKLPEVDAPFR